MPCSDGVSLNFRYVLDSLVSLVANDLGLTAAAYYHTPDPDGTTFEYLPNGDYRFLLSLLKPGSDADNLAEWETYLGPVMRMVGDNY